MSVEMGTRDIGYWWAGLGFLALAKIKSKLEGYSTRRQMPADRIEQNIEADLANADFLLSRLSEYGGSVEGRRVLELGPGQSLGVAHESMRRGAKSYTTFDKFDLVSSAHALKEALIRRYGNTPIQQVVRDDFDVTTLPPVDLIFSMAAFEHFDDPLRTIAQLSKIAARGALLCISVDLKTHSRWICDRDPNNIYRYPDWLYRLFGFPGQPNRVRPWQLAQALSEHGWKDIAVSASDTHWRNDRLHRKFRDSRNQMHIVGVTLCARRE